MTSNGVKSDSECSGDDGSVDSFASALCEIYNDVLNVAIIPEDDEVSFSGNQFRESSPSRRMSYRDRFFSATNGPPSRHVSSSATATKRSICTGSMTSSCMLSIDNTNDDDLSYITEPDFEEKRVTRSVKSCNITAKDSRTSGTSRSLQITESDNAAPSNLRNVSDEGDTLGLHYGMHALRLSDLDAALVSPATLSPGLQCSDASGYDPSLSSISGITYEIE